MSVVGALIEIPTMLSLVKTAQFFRRRLYHGTLDKKVCVILYEPCKCVCSFFIFFSKSIDVSYVVVRH